MYGVAARALGIVQGTLMLVLLVHCGQRPMEGDWAGAGKSNRPPRIRSAEIQPSAPTIQEDLGVVVRPWDPDGDPVANEFQWIVNGEEVLEDTGDILPRYMFKKGDEVQCMITPNDGLVDGRPFVTRSVRIANSLPVIAGLRIEPQPLFLGDEAKAVVEVSDPDGDPATISYDWFVNDLSVKRKEPGLSLAGCKKRDRIYVRVRADDGEGQGPWVRSRVLLIQNRPPRIVSQPPPTWRVEEGFQYVVSTEDPDGDPIRVWIKGELPPGMSWNGDTQTLRWEAQDQGPGSCDIQIVAEDSDGGVCTQRIFLSLEGKS